MNLNIFPYTGSLFSGVKPGIISSSVRLNGQLPSIFISNNTRDSRIVHGKADSISKTIL